MLGNPISRVKGVSKLGSLRLLGIDGNNIPWDVREVDLGGTNGDGYINGVEAVAYCCQHDA